jgi:hypothetical protein
MLLEKCSAFRNSGLSMSTGTLKDDEADLQTETVQIRVRPSEKSAFTQAAEIAGISLSAWARERLRLTAARELESAGRKIPFLKDITLK